MKRVWVLFVGVLGCRAEQVQAPECPLVAVAFDDFERPSQIGLGVAPSGQSWIVSGPGYLSAQIESGRFTDGPPADGNIAYAALFTTVKPIRIGGRFSLVPGAGTNASGIALISSSDPDLTLGHMLHLIVLETGWRLTTWNGSVQDRELEHQPLTPQQFATPLRGDGTVYEVWMTIRGDSVHLELPEGMSADYRDPLVPELSGKQTIWELPYDSKTAAIPRWESVETLAETLGCSSRDVQHD